MKPDSSSSFSVAPTRGALTRRQALGALGALALPWDQLLAQVPAATTQGGAAAGADAALLPDLLNLHPVLQGIADRRSLRLSFLDSQWKDLETWKQEARPEFRGRLSYDPKALSVHSELVRREERDGFTIEVVRIDAQPTYRIPARVLVPKGRSGRLPAVVALHAHGGRFIWGHQTLISHPDDSAELKTKVQESYGRPWAEALVRRGYIVIVIDAFYFGERRLRFEDLAADRVITGAKDVYKAAHDAKFDS